MILSDDAIELMKREIPFNQFDLIEDTNMCEVFISSGLVKSKADYKRLLKQGGLSWESINEYFLLLRKGKKEVALVEILLDKKNIAY